MTAPTIVSIQVGLPRARDDGRGAWHTGYFKEPVKGRVRVRRTNLDGDGQGSPGIHGGPDQAVLAYSAEHYAAWRAELGREFPHGAFAENLTVSGLDESTVCIGDRWRAGDVVLEVTQPRGPCGNIARRWQRPDFVDRIKGNGRAGWYLRVAAEGEIEAGLALALVSRPHPGWTILRAHRVKYADPIDRDAASRLLALPELGHGFRTSLGKRLA